MVSGSNDIRCKGMSSESGSAKKRGEVLVISMGSEVRLCTGILTWECRLVVNTTGRMVRPGIFVGVDANIVLADRLTSKLSDSWVICDGMLTVSNGGMVTVLTV